MWQDVLTAVALVLVIEGILPFLSPRLMRELIVQVARMDDRAVRFGGLTSMVLGVALLYLLR